MRNVLLLLELQNLCDQEAEIKKRFRESSLSLSNLEKTFLAAEKWHHEIKKKIADHKGQLLEENLKLSSIEDLIKKWNTELFSTHNSNPKYLRDIEAKIKETQITKSKSEDKVLEVMVFLEEDEKKSTQVEKDYQDALNLLQMKKESHASLDVETKDTLTKLDQKKNDLRSQIDQEWLKTFDKTFLYSQGKAVSIVSKGACQICKFMIPTSKIDQLYQHKEDLHFCDNCKRIILVN